MIVTIKDRLNLARDLDSLGIINTDSSSLIMAKKQKEAVLSSKQRIIMLENAVRELQAVIENLIRGNK
jgi:hypothetical protein